MQTKDRRVAFATLDIGTSQIKLGVYCPSLSPRIILINSLPNESIYGNAGEARGEYEVIQYASFQLFKELGTFLQKNGIEVLHLGICGHISSLVEWNKLKGTPPPDPFPIWLDTTSYDSLDEYDEVMGNGRSKEIIGTFLPSGTNWLFTKLLHRKKSGFNNDSIILQVGDAICYELSGRYQTHFSSQLSMVNLSKREYAPELLQHLNLPASSLPLITDESSSIDAGKKELFGFPDESFVFPAMADLYTSLYGLRLTDHEGFILANTSEQAGIFYDSQPTAADNFLSIRFDKGFVNYGSTNTGGNIVNWFVGNILKRSTNTEVLNELTEKAAAIEPNHTPIILPYLQGERAPLWNPALTASILELRSSHHDAHLFRAILESIAFTRRHCFEQLGTKDLDVIKIGGGSSKNNLWNIIRSTVLNKRLAVADEKELAMAGIIDYMISKTGIEAEKPAIDFAITSPDPELVEIYNEKYERFSKYQQLSELGFRR